MKIELELVDNGAMLSYPEQGVKFVSKNKELAEDIGRDILSEIQDKYSCDTKFFIEIEIRPL